MAKGQQKSNREAKKPKANKKPTAATAPMRSETATRITAPKESGK